MPPTNLPEGAKKIYLAAEENAKKTTCKDSGDGMDECAARVAWSAVKRKYKKGADGKWTPKADVQEFSMAITRTSYDKVTDTRHWFAVASDTDNDLYKDNMTLDLFQDFLGRIENKESPPESFRSDFWNGGKPYLSVSHYPDFNGKGVPGPVDSVYIDGRIEAGRGKLKAKGRFDDTQLGKVCFQSISQDIEDKVPDNERIRISIAFLDYKHRHKSTSYEFERTEEDGLCPECLKEMVTGEYGGKEFLKGHLIHLALTRVPVNTRTSMEVERSMTTRKEDAESIIGEELAEELEEQAITVGKSEALVIKADEEDQSEEVLEELGKHDKKKDNQDEEDGEEEEKKKKHMKKADVSEFEEKALHLLNDIAERVAPKEAPVHILDIRMEAIKEAYDQALEIADPQEALQSVNEPFEELVRAVQDGLSKEVEESVTELDTEDKALATALEGITRQLALLDAKVSALESNPRQAVENYVPKPRNLNPNLLLEPQVEQKSDTPDLQNKVRMGMGLPPIG